jgi:hypothetical protein
MPSLSISSDGVHGGGCDLSLPVLIALIFVRLAFDFQRAARCRNYYDHRIDASCARAMR